MDKHRIRLRQYANDYLNLHPCIDCGEKDHIVLDFDHRDSKQKKSTISNIICNGNSLVSLQNEIKKCDVRCSNCHRRRHAKDKQVFITEKTKPHVISSEGIERIRQPKLGKSLSEETKAKISASLQGNHCRAIRDLVGQTFGRLTVLRRGDIKPTTSGTRVYWWVQCSCGSFEKQVAGIKLTTNKTKSCGCLIKEFYGNQYTPIIEDSGNARTETRTSDMGADCLQTSALD